MFVRNINGSSRFPNAYGRLPWIKYWESVSGEKATKCMASDCGGNHVELDGAHVQKAYGTDGRWYIVPLCKACNHRTDIFFVPTDMMVPVPSNL